MRPVFRSSGDLIADRRYHYAQGLLDDGDAAGAADLFEQTLERAPSWAAAWHGLGRARLAAGDTAGAAEAFVQTRANDPDDVLGAGAQLARLGAEGVMSEAYVRELFDAYAGRFETHLASLDYAVPALLRQALIGARDRFGTVLDLGCGTGLMGAALRLFCDRLVGCDLAPQMVEAARAKGIYDGLSVADVVAFLHAQPPQGADLVVAADVFVYLGDLSAVFDGAARVLAPGGLFAFSVQGGEGEGWSLGGDLRHAHSAAYLRREAARAGLADVSMIEAVLRQDAGRAVNGLICVFRR